MHPKSPQPSDAEMAGERHLTEKSPGELRALITGFLGSVPGAFIVLDKQWHLVYLNVDAQKILMVKDESLIGRPFDEIYPIQFSHLLAPQKVRGLLEGKENTVTRYSSYFNKWFEVTAYSSDPYIFIRLEDITSETLVNRLHIMNQRSIDSAMDMVFWFKPSGHIIYANTASSNTLGFSKRELMGMMVADIDPSFIGNKWAEFIEGLRTMGSKVYESSLRASNRSIIPVEVTCSYLDYNGEEYLIAFARDIRKRRQDEEALKESEKHLAIELSAMTKLQTISMRFVEEGALDSLLDDIMGAAVELVGADKGTLQLIMPGSEHLDIVAQRGFEQSYLNFFSSVSHGTTAVCATAFQKGERVIVEDVAKSAIFIGTPALDVQLKAGVRAVQSTPLVNRRGVVIGMLSTHWSKPYHPDESVLRYVDLLARQAADIIEWKRAEEALRESEEHYRQLSESLPQLVWTCRADGPCDYLSPQWISYTGIPEDLQLGYNWLDQIHPDDRERVMREWASTAIRGELFDIEFRIRRHDGVYRWFKTRAIPIRDSRGNLVKWFGTNTDIDDLKQAEEKVAHLASFPELNPNPIFEVDADGVVKYANSATKRIFPDLIELGIEHPILHGLMETVGMLQRSSSSLVRDVKIDDRYYQQTIHMVHEMGIVRFYILDITDRKKAEEELYSAKQRAELYLDLMGHDINNMHQVALGYLELAEADIPPGDSRREYLQKPREVLQRSAQLIGNVRKMQKVLDGSLHNRTIDLCGVLVNVQREFGAMPNKPITLNLNGLHQCNVMANELLHDVFANLVSNAIKHTGDKANIVMSLDIVKENGGLYYRAKVDDDGPGIPDESKDRLFNRTLKGTSKARGMGLGLYLVKSLVESYNGRVWMEDRVRGDHTRGARFVVMLPAIEK